MHFHVKIFKNILTNYYLHKLVNRLNFTFQKIKYPRKIQIFGIICLNNLGKISLGQEITINSSLKSNPVEHSTRCFFTTTRSGTISIGNNCGISNTILFSMESIIIEDYVNIGAGCKIYDTDFHSIYFKERISDNVGIKTSPVVIKKGVWIGGNCTILKGVTIGEYSVIGAGSIVTKSIPNNELWAGNPARFIKKIENERFL